MEKPNITKFSPIAPINVQYYEKYIPTAFDNALTMLEKINMLIEYMNRIGELTQGVVEQWNLVMEWVMGDGLKEGIIERLDEWLADGTLAQIINETIFEDLNNRITAVETLVDELTTLMDNKQDIDKLPFVNMKNNADLVTDGSVDMTLVIQAALDALQDGDTLYIPKGTYVVSKNTALSGFPMGDQPCLVLRGKNNVKIIGQGAVFKVNTHAQGIMEIQASRNVTVEGITFQGLGLFPPIDSVAGYGEKGTSAGGYDTSGFWGYHKNNRNDTSARVNPSTSQPYGTFNGGYIGNIGIGLLIHNNCHYIKIKSCEAFGFNYSGFQVGHLGDRVPSELGYGINKHIRFEDCYSHDNYSQNYYSMDSEYLVYERCVSEKAGHPQASINHTYVDPGYGFGLGGANLAVSKHTSILNCYSLGDKRKGIDAHKGEGIIIKGCVIRDSLVGGIFYNSTTAQQKSFDFDISHNKIYNVGSAKNPGAPIQYGGVRGSEYSEDNIKALGRINYNTIENSFGWLGLIEVGVYSNVEVIGNQIKGLMLPANRANVTAKPCGLYIGYSLVEEMCYFGVIKDNIIDGGGFIDLVGGITVRNLEEGVVSGNVFKTKSAEAQFGIRVWDTKLVNVHGNVVWLSSTGIPYESTRNESIFFNNDSRGGNPSLGETPVSGRTIHMRIDATGGAKTISYLSGEQYVASVVNHTRGVQINLKNTQRGIVPEMRAQFAKETGMNSLSRFGGFMYNYATVADYCVLALYDARGGVAIPYDTWDNGALHIFITI